MQKGHFTLFSTKNKVNCDCPKSSHTLYRITDHKISTVLEHFAKFIWSFGEDYIANLTNQTNVFYYINDHIGTPIKVLDHEGTIVWDADYKPFGSADVTINTFGNNFRFQGQYFDTETGLHYNYHRYYDPQLGRYITPDPIGLDGGINLFAYVGNNPVNWVDPLGLATIWVHSNPRHYNPGPGHGWVTIVNDDGSSETVGNYPGGPSNRDVVKTPTESNHWEITQEEADAASEAMNKPWYAAINDNCVDRVEDALDAANIKHPNFNTAGVSDPQNLNDWLEKINKEKKEN